MMIHAPRGHVSIKARQDVVDLQSEAAFSDKGRFQATLTITSGTTPNLQYHLKHDTCACYPPPQSPGRQRPPLQQPDALIGAD
eukprot:3752702-Amphidinium_carterae.1